MYRGGRVAMGSSDYLDWVINGVLKRNTRDNKGKEYNICKSQSLKRDIVEIKSDNPKISSVKSEKSKFEIY